MVLHMQLGPVGSKNVRFGLVFVSVGLLVGLAMSLYAFVPIVRHVPEALDRYDDLGRRMVRLGHIAAIMLPLLNVVFGVFLDGLALPERAKHAASVALRFGAAVAPSALVLQGLVPSLARLHLPALPILSFCAGTFLVSLGALRLGRGALTGTVPRAAAQPW